MNYEGEQLSLFGLDSWSGRMCPELSPVAPKKGKTFGLSSKKLLELAFVAFMYLDLTPGHGDLLGLAYWEMHSPWLGDVLTLNTGVSPKDVRESSLSLILEANVPSKYYLTPRACLGILRRAKERDKELPPQLEMALKIQAGIIPLAEIPRPPLAFHINQREETIDLGETAGALMATTNMQMQTFVTGEPIGFDGYNGDLTDKISSTLGTNCGMSTGRNGVITPIAFAANQRDEVRDLCGIAGALGAQPGMKQQTFLCLNDQGGDRMDVTVDKTATLRAQMHAHQPLVLYENHGIDARYTGPHEISPTISARGGTGGNNLPLVAESTEDSQVLCITGNAIDRQPQNGGNGLGIQEGIAYTLTATDHHAIFSRQRVDRFAEDDVASTESARQHKDATDLVYQATVGALTSSDAKGPNQQYVGQDKLIVEAPQLIRRLTPLECERLQGFPDGWTSIPGATDAKRYKALGNSVAIPCVEFVLSGIAAAIRNGL